VPTNSQQASLTFSKKNRLLNSGDFSYVFDKAPIRASHPAFTVLAKPSLHGEPRLGLVVPKKQIKLAVRRNRIKRIVRESFRLRYKNLPEIDVIVLARNGADYMSNSELHSTLRGLWKRISKQHLKQNKQ
jgi:ribonuclease P protein component